MKPLTAEWLQIHSLDHGDCVAQARLTCNYETIIDIYAGVDVFYGNRDDLFGQFDETDRATIGIVRGF